jgi:hypothetical protein
VQKREDIPEFEKVEQQLHSFLTEISELSKKKPNDALNKFKLKFINGTLDKLNRLLADDRPFQDFERFDEDDLPTNSDVVVILAQYAAATHRFRVDHTRYSRNKREWFWTLRGKLSDTPAGDPDDFKYHPK